MVKKVKEIILAGGCFWGVEAYFNQIQGVKETKVGYANGHLDDPTYEDVKQGNTGHSEAVWIRYDEDKVTLTFLLEKYWSVVDPTITNRQGPDIGHQYRTAVYYTEEEDLECIEASVSEEQKKYEAPIVTEVEKLDCFYDAETYHQKYLDKNPTGYCHIDLSN